MRERERENTGLDWVIITVSNLVRKLSGRVSFDGPDLIFTLHPKVLFRFYSEEKL